MLREANSIFDWSHDNHREVVNARFARWDRVKQPLFSTDFFMGESLTFLDTEEYVVDLYSGDWKAITLSMSVEDGPVPAYGASALLQFESSRSIADLYNWYRQHISFKRFAVEFTDLCGSKFCLGPYRVFTKINSNEKEGITEVQLMLSRASTLNHESIIEADDFLTPVITTEAAPQEPTSDRRIIAIVNCTTA